MIVYSCVVVKNDKSQYGDTSYYFLLYSYIIFNDIN
jgi:hypothetical protein